MIVVCNGIHQPWSVQKLISVVFVGFVAVICINCRLPFISPTVISEYRCCMDPDAPYRLTRVFVEADVAWSIGNSTAVLFQLFALLASLILVLWLIKKGREVRSNAGIQRRVCYICCVIASVSLFVTN